MLTPVLPFPRPGFVVEHVATADATRLMAARARTPAAACPHCPPRSARVHRRSTRRLRALPVAAPAAAPMGERASDVDVRAPAAVPPGTPVATPALRPRSGRSPRLQQGQAAREAARAQRSQEVQPRAAPGQSLQQIARAGGVSRQTVRPWLQTAPLPPEQRGYRGPGKIAPSLPYLRTRTAGAGPACAGGQAAHAPARRGAGVGWRTVGGQWCPRSARTWPWCDTPVRCALEAREPARAGPSLRLRAV